MATKKKAKKAQAKGTNGGPTWRLGLFRNDHGRLVTVYVNSDGEVMPYQRRQVGDRPIVFTGAYSGMKYSEARVQLLKDAKAQKGLENEVVEKSEGGAKAEESKKPSAAKRSAKARAPAKGGRRRAASASTS